VSRKYGCSVTKSKQHRSVYFSQRVEDNAFHLWQLAKGASASLKTMANTTAEGARMTQNIKWVHRFSSQSAIWNLQFEYKMSRIRLLPARTE
jgi:hypothetical protein